MTHIKRLAAFDFDKTIVIDNTDGVVQDLLPKGSVPKYKQTGWTSYMSDIFKRLHQNGVEKRAIDMSITNIKPIPGMYELIKVLSEILNFDVIIISDSNSHFIHTWLREHKLDGNIKAVFTNPAEFTNGLLKIQMYHDQDWCPLSAKNLCKGYILEEFVKAQRNAGITYEQILYAGDGSNDFCPILRLHRGDLAFCREGFKCADLVQTAKAKKPIDKKFYHVKADVHIWSNGFDILNTIKSAP